MICEVQQPAFLVPGVLAALRPRAKVRAWDWICKYGRMPSGTPFDGDRIPWSKGVCDAYDDPNTRSVTLMWGTRLGKTITALQLMACMMATNPMKGLFSQSTQSLVKRTVNERIYPMLEAIDATREQLPPENLRAWTRIALSNSSWNVTWSGSATQLADIDAFYGHAGEVDKWSFNEVLGGEGGEGDALDQWEERFKENPDHKKLFECSPTTKKKSRIYKKLLASNNCRFFVPCKKCQRRQVLKFGGKDVLETGGLLFDKLPDGRLDAGLARETARYVCQYCKQEIYDEDRFAMMRAGVWAPEGCFVDKRGRVQGNPVRSSRHWGGQLSSLYSLQMCWGDLAEKFVNSVGNPRSLQMFVNGWLAEVWDTARSQSEPEEVATRLATTVPRGIIPAWATWLFAAVDVQHDRFVFVVVACGPEEQIAIVDHGEVDTLAEIKASVIEKEFPHQDGGPPLSPAVVGIDCGFKTRDVYAFCQEYRKTAKIVVPVKGANTDCGGEPYEAVVIGLKEATNSRTKKVMRLAGRGLTRIRVSPFYYEPIIQQQLEEIPQGDFGSLSLNEQAANDADLVRQLCNAEESPEPSKMDPDRHLWVKRWENEPNDLRDALKYARCLMDWHFKRNWSKATRRQVQRVDVSRQAPTHKEAEPSGRARGRRISRRERTRTRRR